MAVASASYVKRKTTLRGIVAKSRMVYTIKLTRHQLPSVFLILRVVTAAHCVQFSLAYPVASLLTVDLGDHDLKTMRETKNVVARVSQIVPNIYYADVHNDIAYD